MKINEAGVALIKEFEGLKCEAYQDIVGVWTIGYGDTGPDVVEGIVIDEEEATHRLMEKLSHFEEGVSSLVKTPLNSNQFSALVCFSYNLGLGSLKESTLLHFINKGNLPDAADEFLKWCKARGEIVPGLLRRREAERALFLKEKQV